MVNEILDDKNHNRMKELADRFEAGEDLPEPSHTLPELTPITVSDCMEIIPRNYILDGLIEAETITLFSGKEKIGKTYVLLDMALHMAAGLPWLELETMSDTKGRILWLNLDMSRATAMRRVYQVTHGIKEAFDKRDPNLFDNFLMLDGQSFRDPGYDNLEFFGQSNAFDALKDHIIQQNVKVCFIDNLIQIEGAAEENSSNDIQRVFNRVKQLRDETHCSFILIHHTTKDGGRGRGSGDIFAETDLNLQLDPDINNDKLLKLKTDGARNSALADISMMKIFQQRIDDNGQPMTDSNGHEVCIFKLSRIDSSEVTTEAAKARGKVNQTIEANVREIENYFLRNKSAAMSKTAIVSKCDLKGAKQAKFDSVDKALSDGILVLNTAGLYSLNEQYEK